MPRPSAPKRKSKPESESSGSDSIASESPEKTVVPAKKAKAPIAKSAPSGAASPPSGCKYRMSKALNEASSSWDLGRRKFVTIGTFQNRLLVNVREYYEKKDDQNRVQLLPGRGVALNIEQFNALCESIDDIKAALAENAAKK